MADLMSTLIRPSTSQESFHSTYSTHQPSSPMPSSTDHSTGPLPAHHFTSSQAQDHQSTYDVNAYLDNLANRAYLENSSDGTVPPGPPKYGTRSATTSSEHSRSDNPEPVQLGIPKTSHNVSAFFELCQEKGWTPEFDIQEDLNVGQRFKGSLTVGGQTIHLEEAQPSKKEARQVLSTQGYKLVQQMSARVKCKDDDGERTENWVGKLLEFHSITQPASIPPPSFTDYSLGSSFACECTIAQCSLPLGSRTTPFATKRLAKSAAAKAAVDYLVNKGFLSANGNILTTKKSNRNNATVKGVVASSSSSAPAKPTMPSSSALGSVEDQRAEVEKSWGQRVNELYPQLGLCPPTYRIEPKDPVSAPALFSGAAYFEGNAVIEGPVGEVRQVFGRKKAKEECAKGVWIFLDGLRRKRLGER